VPVVGDLPVLHAIYVNRAEANLATIAFQIFESAGEMSREKVSDNGAVLHNQKLFNFRSQIGNGSAKVLRCLEDTIKTLRASWRECAINEILRERRFGVACLALFQKAA
jgi:hypothetical protein